MTTQTIAVHGWLAGEEQTYVGEGHDVTPWVEALDDDQLYSAAYTFEKSLDEDYEPSLVTLPAQVIGDHHDGSGELVSVHEPKSV